jgi:hypothetical protein
MANAPMRKLRSGATDQRFRHAIGADILYVSLTKTPNNALLNEDGA